LSLWASSSFTLYTFGNFFVVLLSLVPVLALDILFSRISYDLLSLSFFVLFGGLVWRLLSLSILRGLVALSLSLSVCFGELVAL